MSFASLGVPAELISVLEGQGVNEPFAIQAATLADAFAGRDVSGRAPTGSGKTLAFSLPLVAALEGKSRPRSPRGLVLVPTRELAAQVETVIAPLAEKRGLRVASVYGGVGFEPQLKTIRRGVDIVVACPGRLIDLLERQAMTLADVEFVVLDEADRMADMGFLPQVRRLLDQTNKKRQTLLFSATLDGDVDVLVKRYQTDPVRHEVIRDEEEEDNTLHLFWRTPREKRLGVTLDVLKRVGQTVVFTRTKHGADRLATQLQRSDVRAAAIHGGRTQAQRDRALANFMDGQVHVLVATDVAARGIHVDDVDCVLHYDVPEDHKTYVHRSGRTARAGAGGLVVSLVEPEKSRDVTQMQRKLEMAAGIIDPDYRALPTVAPVRKVPSGPATPAPKGSSSDDTSGPGRRGRSRGRRRSSAA